MAKKAEIINVERNILYWNIGKVIAEYALKDINRPMGISGYKLSNKIAEFCTRWAHWELVGYNRIRR